MRFTFLQIPVEVRRFSFFLQSISSHLITDEETGEVTTVHREITPMDNFKAIMSDSMLNIVRDKLLLSQEGILSKFGEDQV